MAFSVSEQIAAVRPLDDNLTKKFEFLIFWCPTKQGTIFEKVIRLVGVIMKTTKLG